MHLHSLAVIVSLFLFLTLNTAQAANPDQYIKAIDNEQLSAHPEWLALLHYRETAFNSGLTSQADDKAFFLSETGEKDANAELKASVLSLFKAETPNEHFSCKFPARARWITRKLNISPAELPQVECPNLNEFRSRLSAKRISLIFAATYLNSPSSMFGHTFLRIDNSTAEDTNLLLSFTVSYAADVQGRDNELMFAYRGIFGGYPGVTSVVPYYEKLKQYIDMENRDIWEFELNLRQNEIDQLVDHSWELMDKNFDYYFFDENCAYRLLALMDVARPGTGLIDDISYQAIPSDTVRWVVSKNLVSDVQYRPSTSTTVQTQIAQLNTQERETVLAIASQSLSVEEALEAISEPSSKAKVLDASYEYTRYDTVLAERNRAETAKLSHRLLAQRSSLGKQPTFNPPPTPATRDDQGHETVRISGRLGSTDDREYAELELRPAYHDLTDLPDGYPEGTQLKFLSLNLKYWEDSSQLDIERLDLIDINSISKRDEFFKPTSWKIAVGGQRSDLAESRPFAGYLKGGSGMATGLFDGILFGYLQASLEAHRDLTKGYALGPGLELGWIRQKHQYQTLFTIDHEHFIEGSEAERYELEFQQGYRLDKNKQVSMSIIRNKTETLYNTEWRIEYRQYL